MGFARRLNEINPQPPWKLLYGLVCGLYVGGCTFVCLVSPDEKPHQLDTFRRETCVLKVGICVKHFMTINHASEGPKQFRFKRPGNNARQKNGPKNLLRLLSLLFSTFFTVFFLFGRFTYHYGIADALCLESVRTYFPQG